ncbi:hypothetical protein Vadar_002051 [Vaccinium darrowii]|uniref:Uncharacterized protein n=1 Tax=Vaccinium darrowii TaxID=229202 RepID=A0ACB7XXD4_9ERIC|nr:hypothetical protein Vadar_002051 [Vaccinium darrowii]
MTKAIPSLFLRLSTAKEVWEAVKNTYSVDQDASKAYQLHCEVISVRQNRGSVISYFGKLQKIWQELDDIDDCIMECANDIAIYTTKVNSECVYKFLDGLNPHLDGVRGHVLSTKHLPGIQAAYAMVCAEANRQDVMLGGNIGEGVVMASQKMPISKKDRKCTHCNGTGHTVDTCFQLHGYPEWHRKGKKTSHKEEDSNPKANLATTLAFTAKSENISSSGDSSRQGDFSNEMEELSIVEPETSHTEDNAPHYSTTPPNNSTQPLSQSSSEILPESSSYNGDLKTAAQSFTMKAYPTSMKAAALSLCGTRQSPQSFIDANLQSFIIANRLQPFIAANLQSFIAVNRSQPFIAANLHNRSSPPISIAILQNCSSFPHFGLLKKGVQCSNFVKSVWSYC